MIRRPPRSTQSRSSAASDVYKRQGLTLVRSPYEPDNLPDQGLHTFSYALYPHSGDWRQAHTDRHAAEFNQPFVYSVTTAHTGTIVPGIGLINCSASNV